MGVKRKDLTPDLSFIGASNIIAKLITKHKTIDIGGHATHIIVAETFFGRFRIVKTTKEAAQQLDISNLRRVWFEVGD